MAGPRTVARRPTPLADQGAYHLFNNAVPKTSERPCGGGCLTPDSSNSTFPTQVVCSGIRTSTRAVSDALMTKSAIAESSANIPSMASQSQCLLRPSLGRHARSRRFRHQSLIARGGYPCYSEANQFTTVQTAVRPMSRDQVDHSNGEVTTVRSVIPLPSVILMNWFAAMSTTLSLESGYGQRISIFSTPSCSPKPK